MNKLTTLLFLLFITASVFGQNRSIPIDTMIVTKHTTTINGSKIGYTANAGMQPVWDELGKPIATLQYTYYKRNDLGNNTTRPLLMSFNGGPGSASVWMHIAYTGPQILNIDDAVNKKLTIKNAEHCVS